jgi:AcrR family transcriptional regulator
MAVNPESARAGEGLRERKKARTRETIVAVAMELFDRQGFAGTTIPEIAEAADVSPRTVSTYFPLKEEIVFEQWSGKAESLAAALDDREAGETTVSALRSWVIAERESLERDGADVDRQRRIVCSDEGLRAIERSRYHDFTEMLAESISRDMGLEPEDLAPRLAAAAMTAILDVLSDERPWDGAHEDPAAVDPVRILDPGLAFVEAGVGALQKLETPSGGTNPATGSGTAE